MTYYITVGTNKISKNLFLPIENPKTNSVKPSGGLWFTIYNPTFSHYNEWMDYLSRQPHLLYYKDDDLFHKQACVITLKDEAKIFYLNNYEELQFLKQKYPLNDWVFDYEKLSQDYDGIFIDYFILSDDSRLSSEEKNAWKKFSVQSLILFNLDVIKCYQKALIEIEPYDIEEYDYLNDLFYTIKVEEEKHQVSLDPMDMEFNYFYQIATQFLKTHHPNYTKYSQREIFEIIDSIVNKHINDKKKKYILERQLISSICKKRITDN